MDRWRMELGGNASVARWIEDGRKDEPWLDG
jgi:hypothetical protein